jgi:hypothetical protein
VDLTIVTVLAPKVTFASHQNSVPVLRELKVENAGDQALEDVVVELEATPPILLPKRWRIDRINANATVELRDLDVALNAGFLLDLHEAVTASVCIRVSSGAMQLSRCDLTIEALAQN